jgi:hypothetical protein
MSKKIQKASVPVSHIADKQTHSHVTHSTINAVTKRTIALNGKDMLMGRCSAETLGKLRILDP